MRSYPPHPHNSSLRNSSTTEAITQEEKKEREREGEKVHVNMLTHHLDHLVSQGRDRLAEGDPDGSGPKSTVVVDASLTLFLLSVTAIVSRWRQRRP
jgi:hypothetical protein